jgi:hypothetical protein
MSNGLQRTAQKFRKERIEVDASVNVDEYEDDVLSAHGELIGLSLVTGEIVHQGL